MVKLPPSLVWPYRRHAASRQGYIRSLGLRGFRGLACHEPAEGVAPHFPLFFTLAYRDYLCILKCWISRGKR
jgi:hypothetical protein